MSVFPSSASKIAFHSPSSVLYPVNTTMKNPKASQPKSKAKAQNAGTSLKARESLPGKRPRRETKPSMKVRGSEAPDIEDLGSSLSKEEVDSVRASLLEWYDLNRRDLPWRKSERYVDKSGSVKDDGKKEEGEEERRAYGVWVSEMMLQQTRVQTVIDYYERWMLRWPTLQHLASASLEEVNEMWAGLGYYRRARFLLEGAKMIVAAAVGFPRTVEALQKIPGIGNYTAGAIASIAFKEVVPVVDGNVIRVLARLKAISANPKDAATIKSFWKLAAQLVDPCRPGDFNQSLMELGATVCTPLNPSCSSCPISSQCHAFSISTRNKSVMVTDYPTKVAKTKQREDFSAVCVVEIMRGKDAPAGNKGESGYILVKRPEEGLLAGLWEFPSVMLNEEVESGARRKVIDHFLKQSLGLDSKVCALVSREDVGDFIHIFSHIRLKSFVELLVVHLKDEKSFFRKQNRMITWKFVDSEALSNLGLTSGVRKVYSMVMEYKQNNLHSRSSQTRKRVRSKQ